MSFTSHFSLPRKPGQENKHFPCQLCHEQSFAISVPRISIESCPHLDPMVSPRCDFGARALAILIKDGIRGPAQHFLNHVEAELILKDLSQTKAVPLFSLNFTSNLPT